MLHHVLQHLFGRLCLGYDKATLALLVVFLYVFDLLLFYLLNMLVVVSLL